jgi:ribose-phosphate pyrophosphokinase
MESIIFILDENGDNIYSDILSYFTKRGIKLNIGKVNKQKFSDGELCTDFESSVRGKRVYLLSSPNTSDEIIKLEFAIDAAKRAAAKEIIPVLPYFPYARQDKKDQSRGPIGAKVMALKLEAIGATSIITFDLHADQIQGFFEIPVTHVEGKNIFASYIKEIATENTVLCGPDVGSGKRVKRMKDQLSKYHDLNLSYIMIDKTRKEANIIDTMEIIGDVKGKDVIILDDMVDTAGTLCKAADELLKHGANSVRAIISHPVLSGNAFLNIGKSVLTELVVSDSLPIKSPLDVCSQQLYNESECVKVYESFKKIRVIGIGQQVGAAIQATDTDGSYDALKNKI